MKSENLLCDFREVRKIRGIVDANSSKTVRYIDINEKIILLENFS